MPVKGVLVSRLADLSALLASETLTQTELADRTGVVLDVDAMQVFALNETGMFLVNALREGASDRGALLERLVEALGVKVQARK